MSPGSDTDRPDADRAPGVDQRIVRWRLILGDTAEEGPTPDRAFQDLTLTGEDAARDRALAELYGSEVRNRRGGLGGSSPAVARWLGDIRTYFPSSVVQVMQADAMERLGLADLLLEPEMIDAVQPDIGMVATLLGLGRAIPEHSRESARVLIKGLTDELSAQLADAFRQAVSGALDRANRTRRPRAADINWDATVRANLAHYQPEHRTVVPHRLVGHARRRRHMDRQVVVCLDQSGSMAESVVYASVFGAVLASLPGVDVRIIAFDTVVVDLTDVADDPVDVLFGVQLGGGTDINAALAYCQGLISQPSDTVLVLISDLFEGGAREEMLRRFAQMMGSGVTCVALLALSDVGRPAYDADNASALAELGVPAFACTPDLFGDMMAAAINGEDLARWAGRNHITVAAPTD